MLLLNTMRRSLHGNTKPPMQIGSSNILATLFLPILLFLLTPLESQANCYVNLPSLSENNECVEAAYAPYSSYGTVEFMWARNINGSISPVTGWATNHSLTYCPTEPGYYRMCARKIGCSAIYESPDVYVNPNPPCVALTDAGSIASNQVECEPYTPTTIQGSEASGGSGSNILYQWQKKTTGSWANIPGATSKDYSPSHITETTRFRRRAKRNDCGNWINTNVVIKHVKPAPFATATSTDATCGSNNGSITFSFPDEPTRTNIKFSFDGGATYTFGSPDDAGSKTKNNMAPGTYDLWVHWGNTDCPKSIGQVTINDSGAPLTDAGNLGENEVNCEAYTPSTITGTAASGGSGGSILYQWQKKTTGSWEDIAGANGRDYTPGHIIETTRYRRRAKRDICGNWMNTNVVVKHVKPGPAATFTSTDGTCGSNNGSITFSFPDEPTRTNIKFSFDGGATYTFGSPDDAGSKTKNNMAPGTYDLWVRWGNEECPTSIGQVTINNVGEPLTDPGAISGNQVNCEPYDPAVIVGTVATGTNVQYQWQEKITSWNDIPGATAKDYDPDFITQSTWYRRLAKSSDCGDWVNSNNVDKHVKPGPTATLSKTDPDCNQDNGTITFTFSDDPNRTNIEFSTDGGATYPLNVPDNSGSTTISSLGAGTYNVWVRWGNDDCPSNLGNISLTEPDADNDNVCDADDCAPNDPNYPALPGNPCNDGDPNTENDVVTSDGCGCAGTPVNVCDNITWGGTIGLGSGGFFSEEETCNPCSVPVIQSNATPTGGSGALEIAWIKRPMSDNLQDCQNAFSELAAFNVGELFDIWVANGSNPNNSQIGTTSWMFVSDNDSDDLSLTLDCLQESTCFVRCARRDNCEPFTGESNFVRIEINAGLNGGTLGVEPPTGGTPYLGGAAICTGDAVPAIATSVFDNGFTGQGPNGETLEFVWLQTSNASNPTGAFGELASFNVGQLYNNWVANGSNPNAAQIAGTSWRFASDNDGDDLKLSLSSLSASAAFVRCARVVGDLRFCGESSFASITVEDCSPQQPSCTYNRCNGVATITGVSNSAINAVKILDADVAGLPEVFACGTFLGQQCGDPIVFNLPNPNGNYIVSVICDDGNHYEYLTENCGGNLVQQGSNEAENTRVQSNTSNENNQSISETRVINEGNTSESNDFTIYPNPAKDNIFINLAAYAGQSAQIIIYNNLGQEVLTKEVNGLTEAAVQISLPGFSGGIYTAKILLDNNVQLAKQFVVNLTR